MVESIVQVEQTQRNVFNIGGSNTGSEVKTIHLKRWKGEGVETENISDVSCRAAKMAKQKRLEKTRNVQVSTSTDTLCAL